MCEEAQALSDESPENQKSVLIAMGLKLDGGGWFWEGKEFIGDLRCLGPKGGLIYSVPAPDREGEISAVWPTDPSGRPQMLSG